MNKIVYNGCFGGFGLSEEALQLYKELSGEDVTGKMRGDFVRHDPILVRVVEELGEDASGFFARLMIEEIEGSTYRIDEYDGNESVEVPSDIEWVKIPEQTK